jgi:hypothetical protein
MQKPPEFSLPHASRPLTSIVKFVVGAVTMVRR